MTGTVTQEELQAGRDYESLFVPALFSQWTGHLLQKSGVTAGSSVLDVACGSGVLARAALQKSGTSGRVVGVDPAPGMIAAAREVEPHIEWILGSAEDLPFADGSFDCVISQFGIMFFQDRLKALQEMFRVARAGGHLAIAIWHSIDQNPAYKDIVALLDQYVSSKAGDAVKIPFCLGHPEDVEGWLAQVGYENIAVETRTEQASFPNTRTMVEVELRGWLPLFDIHLTDEKIADILMKSDATLSKYASPTGEAVFPTSAYIITARKPD
ncbi:Demethylmenaquinone methyltransferase [Roseovarius albus]|uniref:Demethylmenaquinone methyltransferase n=1 Tax=Roseovarius albus TaxID=1247867 RepID=A0A1X6YJY3_9RHOB|nr:methyltransferase domain-containing protein [Roseovarius albus]SLN23549.1 Demethylmenaquinone methyltransferase [Roseovarius albus]